jgi:hypothetical protein
MLWILMCRLWHLVVVAEFEACQKLMLDYDIQYAKYVNMTYFSI